MSAVELCFKVHARIGLLRLFYNDFSCWAKERVSRQIVAGVAGIMPLEIIIQIMCWGYTYLF